MASAASVTLPTAAAVHDTSAHGGRLPLSTATTPRVRLAMLAYGSNRFCVFFATRFFGFDAEPPPAVEVHPLCEQIHAEFKLEALRVDDVRNAGNPDFPVYGLSPTLRYGLYRLARLPK